MTYVFGAGAGLTFGPGFYESQQEAEQYRTLEVLKDTASPKSNYLVFELEVPNPAYHE